MILALKTTETSLHNPIDKAMEEGIVAKAGRLLVTVLVLHAVAKLVSSFN